MRGVLVLIVFVCPIVVDLMTSPCVIDRILLVAECPAVPNGKIVLVVVIIVTKNAADDAIWARRRSLFLHGAILHAYEYGQTTGHVGIISATPIGGDVNVRQRSANGTICWCFAWGIGIIMTR